jgi:hypothetical protein
VRGSTTMNDTPVTPAELFKSLRASTAALLGYDVDHLSAEQTIRTDRAVTLRLLCDHLQAQQLHGVAIDVHEFVSASEALERMITGRDPEAPPPEARFGVDHKAKLRRLIETTVLAAEVEDPYEAELRRDILAREELASALAAGVPPPVAPPPPPRPDNVIPLDGAARANSALPPAHYLKQREPWERYYDGHASGPHPWPLLR